MSKIFWKKIKKQLCRDQRESEGEPARVLGRIERIKES
jgi:hypothetical protein